jgi:CRISPR/Cas system-associated exonuclease Cas4 (RecB family)
MYRKVVKLPEPVSYHLANGVTVHSFAENYLLGKVTSLPPVLGKFKKEFQALLDSGAKPEEEFVLNNKWEHIPDGWMDNEAWLRLKLDARIDNYIVDFKTGKVYEEHIHQGRLYANVHMVLNPSVESVDVEFWYLNSGAVVSHTFYRKDLGNDIADWERRVAKLHSDVEFKPTPHEYCKYCYVKHLCNAYR